MKGIHPSSSTTKPVVSTERHPSGFSHILVLEKSLQKVKALNGVGPPSVPYIDPYYLNGF